MDTYEMKTPVQNHVTSANGDYKALSLDRDRRDLARLGKKQVLKRNFGFMSMMGFSCTVMMTWEGILVLFLAGLQNGGPAGTVYGYLIAWIGSMTVVVTISELASMAPTSGGQYHWVSMLAPPSSQAFLSYVTGWTTLIGWQATIASSAYLGATMIQGVVALNLPDYTIQSWQGTLILWAIIVFAVFFNTIIVRLLPQIEGLILILHILGLFAILIPLVYIAPHDSAEDVFATFLNQGNWPSEGIAFFLGLLFMVFSFLGTDGVVHMSEEIDNASMNVPRTMIISTLLNGVLGFGMLIGLLFCLGDLDAALQSPTGYPFMEIFLQGVQSQTGATFMVLILIILTFCGTISIVATSSRLYWAFARDRGLPGWRYLVKLDPQTSIPVIAIATTTLVSCLLALVNIGSTIAFNDIVSLTIAGLYTSYLITCAILLWRRCTGAIALPSADLAHQTVNTTGAQLVWGPFRVPGIFGIITNTVACAFMVIVIFFSFWPPATPVTPQTMNFSSLMFSAVVIFAVVYYFMHARKTYTGPVIEAVEAGS